MGTEAKVFVCLGDGEKDIWSEDVIIPLVIRGEVVIRDSVVAGEVKVVDSACI